MSGDVTVVFRVKVNALPQELEALRRGDVETEFLIAHSGLDVLGEKGIGTDAAEDIEWGIELSE